MKVNDKDKEKKVATYSTSPKLFGTISSGVVRGVLEVFEVEL